MSDNLLFNSTQNLQQAYDATQQVPTAQGSGQLCDAEPCQQPKKLNSPLKGDMEYMDGRKKTLNKLY